MDIIASMPWPLGIAFGIAAYFAIRYGAGWFLSSFGGPIFGDVGQQVSSGALAPLAWLVLAFCWIAAGFSAARQRKRKTLLETQTGLDSLRGMSWRDFERLVGESFRRRGYTVEETGLGGKDGGIDLIVRKDGRCELVQCKQWKNRQVTVAVVREMWGLTAHHHADAVHIVCVGEFTADAEAFASGKPIQLVTGQALLDLIRAGQSGTGGTIESARNLPASVATTTTCPACGSDMVRRNRRSDGAVFLGCSQYPNCRGTLPMSS